VNRPPDQTQDGERRRPGRPRNTDDEAVARAVLAALVERGFDGMTVDHVARLAGVGRATLYRRWPSKTAMVIDALGRSRLAELEDPQSGDPQADFEHLMRILHAAIEREHQIVRTLEIETDRNPDLGIALRRDFVAQRKDVLIGVLRRAAADGLLRAPSDLELLARLGPALIWEHFAFAAEGPPDSDLPRRISELIFADRPRRRPGKR
jgi:AcrR family transcriptional regulator